MANALNLGGGRCYFEKSNGAGGYEPRVELGNVLSLKLSYSQEQKDATTYDDGAEETIMSLLLKKSFKLSGETQNTARDNLALLYLGSTRSKVYEIGETLLDGSVAAEQVTIEQTELGVSNKLLEGRFIFASANLAGEDYDLYCHRATLAASGDYDLISQDYAKLAFEVSVLKDQSITEPGASQYATIVPRA